MTALLSPKPIPKEVLGGNHTVRTDGRFIYMRMFSLREPAIELEERNGGLAQ